MNLLQISTLEDDTIKLSRNAGYRVTTRGNTQERRKVQRWERLQTRNKILVKTYCIHNVIKTSYLNCSKVTGQSTNSNLYFYNFPLAINVFTLVQLIRHSSKVFININSILIWSTSFSCDYNFPTFCHVVSSIPWEVLGCKLMLQLRSDMLFLALRVPLKILIDCFKVKIKTLRWPRAILSTSWILLRGQ